MDELDLYNKIYDKIIDLKNKKTDKVIISDIDMLKLSRIRYAYSLDGKIIGRYSNCAECLSILIKNLDLIVITEYPDMDHCTITRKRG